MICLSRTEVGPGTAALAVPIFSLLATTALLVLDQLGEQLADLTPCIAQELPALARRTIEAPSNAPLSFLDRAQISVALQAVQDGIKSSCAQAVTMTSELLDNSQAEDRVLRGVVKDVKPDQT